jgi:tetratricopeptide (TPR) repeat protein
MFRTIIVTATLGLWAFAAVVGAADPADPAVPDPGVLSGLVDPGRPHGQRDPHGRLAPEKLIQVALQHRAEGRSQEALNTLGQAILRHPDHAQLHAVRGSLYLEQGRVSAALADLESAVRLAPDDPNVLINRAQAYRRFGRGEEALADLNRAVALAPDLLAARFNRGAMLYGMGRADQAMADFDHAIAIDPHVPGPYFNRAAVFDSLGRRAEALADLRRFLELADNDDWRRVAEDLLQSWERNGAPAEGGNEDS